MALERLQKILANAGVASRRAAEKYIVDGRVRINGKVARELGAKADVASDRIEVDGWGVVEQQRLVWTAVHKPIHVVTTVSDPERRPTVMDVLDRSRAVGPRQNEGELPRLFPVGRLDFDAEGLVLMTNDGELANRLLQPRSHVPKTYTVKVKGRPDDKGLGRLRRGVRLRQESGRLSRPTKPAGVQVLKKSPANTWLELTIVEGRHHQVKLMCQAIGHPVLRLIRTDFGGIGLDPLPPGTWRYLSQAEIETLRTWTTGAQKKVKQTRPSRSSRDRR